MLRKPYHQFSDDFKQQIISLELILLLNQPVFKLGTMCQFIPIYCSKFPRLKNSSRNKLRLAQTRIPS